MSIFNLQEAYYKMYEQEQLDEISVETIKSASDQAGRLAGQAAALGAPEYAKKKRAQQERLYAQQAKKRLKTKTAKITREELEILEYLVAEGYADTNENALIIMVNMSEDWRNSIVEELNEAFKPMNEPKMQAQIKRHLKRDNAKRARGEIDSDNRVGNMRNALKVIGPQQKSKGFAEKKTEKGRRTFAKQNADKFLLKDRWHGGQVALGRKPTVPGRHISRNKEEHEKHVERLKKKGEENK